MTIIRNDRMLRQETEAISSDAMDEEEIDYRWHPTEDEFVSPLTAEQWSELLGDSAFADTDAFRAVVCLKDYGGPATFQQLSIRYRGTMGRYRRWLGEAAQAAGKRFGVPAPMQNQYGMDEWWPLLYLTRATGKPGAGVFEMVLRDEVLEGFNIIAEKEKMAKRAENARQLQRIEQLERARAEERERRAAQMAKSTARKSTNREDASPAPKKEVATKEPAATQPATQPAGKAEEHPQSIAVEQQVLPTEAVVPQPQIAQPAPQEPEQKEEAKSAPQRAKKDAPQQFLALRAFLDEMAAQRSERKANEALPEADAALFDITGPVDYALRYAERLRRVFSLMQAGSSGFTAAAAAREIGDDSVQALQNMLNGQEIPSFAYLGKLRDRLFINTDFLEAMDGGEDSVAAFLSLQELVESGRTVESLFEDDLRKIVYLVDDSELQRTGVVFCYSPLRCALLSRESVEGNVKRSSKKRLTTYTRMVSELDKYARAKGIERKSITIPASKWDELSAGSAWPGFVQ